MKLLTNVQPSIYEAIYSSQVILVEGYSKSVAIRTLISQMVEFEGTLDLELCCEGKKRVAQPDGCVKCEGSGLASTRFFALRRRVLVGFS